MAANTTSMDRRLRKISRRGSLLTVLGAVLVGAISLCGCGSSTTTTASVAHTAHVRSALHSSTGTTAHTTPTPPEASAQQGAQRAGAPPAAGVRRSAPAPAFTQQAGSDEGLGSALHVLAAHGFTAADTSTYHSGQTLRVLVGTRTGSSDGYAQQAFFFEDERYLGTDASDPSAAIKVIRQSDTEVTLAYELYHSHDPLCCPKGGEATVRFQLDNGRLQALDQIPPASSATAPERQ